MPSVARTFDLKTDAVAWAAEIERDIRRGGVAALDQAAQRVTVADAASAYMRARGAALQDASQRGRIHATAKRFGAFFVGNVRSADVARWRDDMTAAGLGPQSVRHHLHALSAIFRHAEHELSIHLPSGNPCRAVRKPSPPPGRDRRLSGLEFDYLARAAKASKSPDMHALFTIAVETTSRQSELLALRWADIDLARRVAKVRGKAGGSTKNGDPYRTVALSTAAIAALSSLPRRIDGQVFAWAATSHLRKTWRSTLRHALRMYKADCAATRTMPDPAFLFDLHFHDLRHEATSRLFEKGLGIMEVASMTGHKSLSMLKRYTHIEAEKLARKLG